MERSFQEKWQTARTPSGDERSLFVPPGERPRTQRQFNLFSYYKSIDKLLGDAPISRGVEFGCGRGTIGQYLSIYRQARMALVDNSEAGINLAKENFAAIGQDADFVCADAAATGLQSDYFDAAVSIGLLEHIPDYRPVLREKFRVLKPGGLLFCLNVPGKWSVQNLNAWYKRIIAPFAPAGSIRKDYYRNNDRPERYLAAAKEVGFTDCRVVNVNPYPIWTPVPSVVEHALAAVYRCIDRLRRMYKKEPMETWYAFSQGHYLIARKPPYVSR